MGYMGSSEPILYLLKGDYRNVVGVSEAIFVSPWLATAIMPTFPKGPKYLYGTK